jgi:glycosyltransferase involved in cell wall biosynthesis
MKYAAEPDIVSFIVPALNEERNIEATVAELDRTVALAKIDRAEIVFVNDGSTDSTGAIMARLAAERPGSRYIENPRRLSLGGAYKVGIRAATGTYVMLVPGDNEHPAEGLLPILAMRGKADIVIPYVTNPRVRSFSRVLTSRLFTGLLNLTFGLRVPYYNGLVIHRRALLQNITIDTDSYAYQAEAIVKLLKSGCDFVTVGTVLTPRHSGPSSAFKLHNVIRVIFALAHLVRAVKLGHFPTSARREDISL